MTACDKAFGRGARVEFSRASLFALVLAGLLTRPALAQTAGDFYAGKTVTIVVGAAANAGHGVFEQSVSQFAGVASGGGEEAYARIFARFLGSHIPGAPRVVVQILPGEGGQAPLPYLETAPHDGTVLASFNPGVIAQALNSASPAESRLANISWIGAAAPDFRVCYALGAAGGWGRLAQGEDDSAAPRRDLAFGATTPLSRSYAEARILRMVFARRVRAVLGYPGRNDIYYAIARGELDGSCGPLAGLPATWLSGGAAGVFVRLVKEPLPGFAVSPPYLGAFAKTDAQRASAERLTAANEFGGSLVVSRQTPPERLGALRAAFSATMRDPRFLVAAARQNLAIAPRSGEESQTVLERVRGEDRR